MSKKDLTEPLTNGKDFPESNNAGESPKKESKSSKNSSTTSKEVKVSRGGRLIIMLILTCIFFIVEMSCGYLSHSMALIADSFHMLSDVMALAIAYGCMRIAERSTKKNTFGWVRAEVLGALINGVFLLALCFTIFMESITRIFEPEMIKEPRNVFIVGIIGLIINLLGMLMFHAHSHSHGSHMVDKNIPSRDTIEGAETKYLITSHQDRAMALAELEAAEQSLMPTPVRVSAARPGGGEHLNMRGVFVHIVSDAIGSIIVIGTAAFAWLVPGYEWLKLYMDPCLSILLVLLMVCITFPLVHETALILLQTTPKFVEIEKIKNELLQVKGIVAVHEFHVWRLVGERIIATVHIRFQSVKDYLEAAEKIRALFHDNHIHSTTIQPEFSEMESSTGSSTECAFSCLPTNCALSEAGVTCCAKTPVDKKTSKAQLPTTINFEEEVVVIVNNDIQQ